MKNKLLPIISVVIISIVLWGSIALSEDYICGINAPVELSDLPQQYAPFFLSGESVYVRLKGKGWELAKICMGGEHKFYVSSPQSKGRHTMNLKNEFENNPWIGSSVSVVEIIPSEIKLRIEDRVTKKAPVEKNFKISFAQGFGLASEVEFIPDSVVVSGPESILKNVESVKTDTIKFENVNESQEGEVDLLLVNGIEYSTDRCKFKFDVEKIIVLEFKDIPVKILNTPPDKELLIFPVKINVILRGGLNKLGRLSKEDIKVFADYRDALGDDEEMLVPRIIIPKYTELVGAVPSKLKYIIRER
ncbi:YbbR family protein [Melioribacter roseus P3M-2]|uniref:YbbR family protein n=1 Tax=Melioribacter roseus (strain DSM 23840 / JCM 17771 / VKM B-2668 / P3M-2) TaxID=1191523 RepID=I6YX25_MELRP|nr:YbbR-like domain-containing protein [Melioribacter roseus]AFN75132.1 YbbR family protein [Melioribacter roseus P3M-2]